MAGRPARELVTLEGAPANQVIAMLLATGKYKVPEIARQVGMPASRIYALQESPLFQQMVAEYARRFQEDAIDDVMQTVRDDALHNVGFLKSVRDGEVVDSPKNMPFRMRASEILFDRQVKKPETKTNEAPRIVVNIDARKLNALETVMVEDGGEPIPIETVDVETGEESITIDED